MSKFQCGRFFVGTAFICLFQLSAYAKDTGAYIQLFSSKTIEATSHETVVPFDSARGFSIDQIRDKVTFHVEGNYYIMVEGQVGSIIPGAKESGYVDVWFRHNGQAVPDSASRHSVRDGSTATIVTQDILHIKPGDTVSVAFDVSNPKIGFVAFPAQGRVPTITSIDLTIYKID
jgi:hypothetical protein